MPQPGQQCPLWSDNSQIHESDVARGAIEAKNEMDRENPDVQLKHDPAKDINLAAGNVNNPNMGVGHAGPPGVHRPHYVHGVGPGGFAGPPMPRIVPDIPVIPPGLEGVLPADPMERIRMVREQERLEAMIRGHRGGPPGHHHHAPHHPFIPHYPGAGIAHRPMPNNPADAQGQRDFIDRMGELLQLREVQRQRNRAIRRREQQALEEFNIHRIAHPERLHNRGGAEAPPPPGAPGAPGQGAIAAAAGGPHPPQPPPPYALHPPQPPRPPVINVNPIPPAHNVQPAPPLPPPPQAHGGREALPPQAHQRGPPYQGWVGMGMPAPPPVNPWRDNTGGIIRRGLGFAAGPIDAPAAAPVPPAGRLGRAAQGGPFQIRIEQRQQQPPPPPRRPGEFQAGPPPQPPVTQAQQPQPPQQRQQQRVDLRQQQQRVDLRAPVLR